MLNTQTPIANEPPEAFVDLASDELDDVEDRDGAGVEDPTTPFARTPSVAERLQAFAILPPDHERLPERVLEQIEELYVAWYGAADDAERRAQLHDLLPTEADARRVLLAVVPLYFDTLFFDEKVPTRDLVSLMLVGHAKWRRWLSAAR
jgi:hypothetical protein